MRATTGSGPTTRPARASASSRRNSSASVCHWHHRVTVRRHLVFLLPFALLLFGSAGAEGPARTPGAASTAWAIKLSLPNAAAVTTPVVASPPNGAPSAGGSFTYPSDGSVLTAASATSSATTSVQANASAKAESVITAVSLFKGEITAD